MEIVKLSGYKDIAALKSSADIVREIDDKTTYIGFCLPGTKSVEDPNWAVLQIQETSPGNYPNDITMKWAQGSALFQCKFSLCEQLDYTFKTF